MSLSSYDYDSPKSSEKIPNEYKILALLYTPKYRKCNTICFFMHPLRGQACHTINKICR